MHAKPDLRVFLEWMIADSDSVITDVIQTGESMIEHRLPLDSGEWKSSPSMWNANQRLQALLQSDTPIPESIVDFIYEFEGCDCFERS